MHADRQTAVIPDRGPRHRASNDTVQREIFSLDFLSSSHPLVTFYREDVSKMGPPFICSFDLSLTDDWIGYNGKTVSQANTHCHDDCQGRWRRSGERGNELAGYLALQLHAQGTLWNTK
ncbi:hypothetical protein F7725_015816, partial [Dissostichus mawsoni]